MGVILLTAMVVVSVGVVGAYVLSDAGGSASTTVELRSTVDAETLQLSHHGGDSLAASDFEIRIASDGGEASYDFVADNGCAAAGDGDDAFEAGERWCLDGTPPYDTNDEVRVSVVDTETNQLLYRARKVARPAAATATPAPEAVEVADGDDGGGGDADGGDADGDDADGGGGGGDGGTSIELRIDDLTNRDTDEPYYVVSYDVTPANDSFERVEVEFASESVSPTETETRSDERGSATYVNDYGANADYTITVRTYYADGDGGTVVGRTRTVDDTADTDNPVEEDLSEDASPSLDASTTITDRSKPNTDDVWYRFDYAVYTDGNFQRVLLGVVNRNGNGGTVRTERSQSSGKVDLKDDYGAGTEYKVTILVFDADGVVVDELTLIDVADGNGP